MNTPTDHDPAPDGGFEAYGSQGGRNADPQTGFGRWFHRNFDLSWPIVLPTLALVGGFMIATFLFGEQVRSFFDTFQSAAYNNLGWMLVLSVNVALFAVLYFALGPYGNIRLGGAQARPEFKRVTWWSMLFSAGMGIGLVYFGVAEPLLHYTQPPFEVGGETQRAALAFRKSFLHYGLHPWAVYALVGLGMAFFTFNRGLPLTVRSIFHPLLGRHIHGWGGHAIDIIAVFATLIGLATTLGLGVQQVGSGLSFLFGVESTTPVHLLLIAGITGAATLSVVSGLKKGIRILSLLNIALAVALMVALLFLGPTGRILDVFVQGTGNYLTRFLSEGTWTGAFREDNTWRDNWTVFYWAWWIAWSPFVGIFIARISKGRTVREFILSVLTVPVLFTFFWFAVFGMSALDIEMRGIADLGASVVADFSTGLFVMLEQYPFTTLTSVLAIILVTSFFVTSSDSGSLVVDMLTSGGKLDAPVGQRIFWALMEGAVAGALLVAGGLKAMQSMSIAAGVPYAVLLMVMVVSIRKGFDQELKRQQGS